MSIKHDLYLAKHSGELDAGAWAKLVNAKLSQLDKKSCTNGEDLLSKWHHQKALNVEALHKKENAAIKKWTGEMNKP